MNQGSQIRGEIDRATIAPPNRVQCLMAPAGVVLMAGPTLAVLWPR
ncbi:MAG: hypothetical protein ACRYGP_04395 [Janthinobacterium lividum]